MRINKEDLLQKKTVTAKDAADYLGISWYALTDLLQQGKVSFGTATLGHGGRWSYKIWPERLIRFKEGTDTGFRQEAQALAAEAAKLNERIEALLELMKRAS